MWAKLFVDETGLPVHIHQMFLNTGEVRGQARGLREVTAQMLVALTSSADQTGPSLIEPSGSPAAG